MSEAGEEFLSILQLTDKEAIRDLERICQSIRKLQAQRALRRADLAEISLQAMPAPSKDKQMGEQEQQQQESDQGSEETYIPENASDSDTMLNYSVQSELMESPTEPPLSPTQTSSDFQAKLPFSCQDGKTFGNRHRALILICQEKLRPYGIPMYEFSMSFSSGHALCALIHSYRPDLIDTKYLKCNNPAETLRYGENVANRLGVHFDGDFVRYMRQRRPCFIKIFNFVSQLYAILEEQKWMNCFG